MISEKTPMATAARNAATMLLPASRYTQPAQSSPEAADQLSYSVDVEDQCKAYAGRKAQRQGKT